MIDESLLEPCPHCGKDIECTELTCPFCKVDLTGTAPKPKAPKALKPKPVEKPKAAPKPAPVAKPPVDAEASLLEPCPNCSKPIDCTELSCPFCKMDLSESKPKAKPKKVEAAPVLKNARPVIAGEEIRRYKPSGWGGIAVPALARAGTNKVIDFSEMHWKAGLEVNDDTLLEWAYTLREVWSAKAEDRNAWLTNHALGYLALYASGPHDAPLRTNSQRIVTLLGGDDWK